MRKIKIWIESQTVDKGQDQFQWLSGGPMLRIQGGEAMKSVCGHSWAGVLCSSDINSDFRLKWGSCAHEGVVRGLRWGWFGSLRITFYYPQSACILFLDAFGQRNDIGLLELQSLSSVQLCGNTYDGKLIISLFPLFRSSCFSSKWVQFICCQNLFSFISQFGKTRKECIHV